jgi:hypothetical protein
MSWFGKCVACVDVIKSHLVEIQGLFVGEAGFDACQLLQRKLETKQFRFFDIRAQALAALTPEERAQAGVPGSLSVPLYKKAKQLKDEAQDIMQHQTADEPVRIVFVSQDYKLLKFLEIEHISYLVPNYPRPEQVPESLRILRDELVLKQVTLFDSQNSSDLVQKVADLYGLSLRF